MAVYKYKARSNDNKTVSGAIEAPNEHIAATLLKEKGLTIISLNEEKSGMDDKNILIFKRVRSKDLVIFARQFSVLISANVPLVQSIKTLVTQTTNPYFKTVLTEVANDVDGGSRLSDAFAKEPEIFSNFFISVIRSGETSGKLDEVLLYLADELEKDYDMMAKIKGAMIYPAFVLTLMGAVGFFMMTFIMPKLTAIFTESDTELPLATRILVFVSNFLAVYWWVVIIALIFLLIGLRYVIKSDSGKRFFDKALLKTPIFGKLFRKIYIVRFARSMHTLIAGGVSISNSLTISAEVVNNDVFGDLIEKTREEIEDGNSISGVFAQSDEMPKLVSQMLSTGEKTGRLDLILEKITQFYTREINNIIANLMTLIEPVIIIVLAIGVAGLVMAIIMPMWNLASSID